ncbi:conserved virulence factor C family protein [Aquibacillus salsiterrae]|uniref:Conserved virulence factor C family protein n=1 Tax=Aquibacillus salsiterrae TaxID=2950439 RepID=A0A9X3WBJ7_9BACI|nr:conserved virulence factor C family protein [Aquibacillus salsiterrae]MDC3416202.1 conserved virulence factor C family protein [Aquibacillus salsiterrae]
MKIVSIEPTPSPHSMKINVTETLPMGENSSYKLGDDLETAPDYIQKLFAIEGVKGIYRVIDFIALERNPKIAWESILPHVREVLGTEENIADFYSNEKAEVSDTAYGEIKVFIQQFRGIPIQVKLEEADIEKRFGLPDRFMEAVMKAAEASPNVVMERKWMEQRPRYGAIDEIGQEVVDELSASFDKERLTQLVAHAFDQNASDINTKKQPPITIDSFNSDDWKVRYAALDRLEPSLETLDILGKALDDEKAAIRRLATAYLGMIEAPEVLPYLYKALKDKAVTVRRTAGDCLSDLGFTEAIPKMIESLADSNRLVRWRAAMFLYELGDEAAIPSLEAAVDDPEFEVRMQVNMALQRIKGGEEAKGSVWHQMTQATKETKHN